MKQKGDLIQGASVMQGLVLVPHPSVITPLFTTTLTRYGYQLWPITPFTFTPAVFTATDFDFVLLASTLPVAFKQARQRDMAAFGIPWIEWDLTGSPDALHWQMVTTLTAFASTPLCYGPLRLEPALHTVFLQDQRITSTYSAFYVLEALLQQPERPIAFAPLQQAWQRGARHLASSRNGLEVCIHTLRKQLGAAWIQTHRGIGYALTRPPG